MIGGVRTRLYTEKNPILENYFFPEEKLELTHWYKSKPEIHRKYNFIWRKGRLHDSQRNLPYLTELQYLTFVGSGKTVTSTPQIVIKLLIHLTCVLQHANRKAKITYQLFSQQWEHQRLRCISYHYQHILLCLLHSKLKKYSFWNQNVQSLLTINWGQEKCQIIGQSTLVQTGKPIKWEAKYLSK